MLFPDKSRLPEGFVSPTSLPETVEQASEWQAANKAWWERHPMRYDFKSKVDFADFTKEFYAEIDRRFFSSVREFMPWNRLPFDPLIDFSSLRDQDILEIGVGNGSHAQLLAQHARSFTGIDLTEYAVKSTTARLLCFGLPGHVIRMDAEQLQFADDSFDFIWSWGVIHHSSNTRRILGEMRRVLRPGGKAITMVYHRSFWYYYILGGLFNGVLRGRLFKTRSLHQVTQQMIDGALARYYTIPEWTQMVTEFFTLKKNLIYGSKAEIVPLPGGRFKTALMTCIPNPISRLLTNRWKMGYFLVSILEKPKVLAGRDK